MHHPRCAHKSGKVLAAALGLVPVLIYLGLGMGGDNSQLYLEYTGVPEPTVLMLVAGGALIAVARRRKA